MLSKPISTFVINMKGRPERRRHAWQEFAQRSEFDVSLVDAHEHEIGAIGLWHSIVHIVSHLAGADDEFILICEDDHQFTEDYSPELLSKCIEIGKANGADIVMGGVSFTNSILPVSDTLFWTEWFWGTQFTIVFKKFFPVLLGAPFGPTDSADDKYSELTFNKFFIYPFISIQKEFGYSDASPTINYLQSNVAEQFFASGALVNRLIDARRFVRGGYMLGEDSKAWVLDDVNISTHLICGAEHVGATTGFIAQFDGRGEFDVTRHIVGVGEDLEYAKWIALQNAVRKSLESDDVIIVVTPEHVFSQMYSVELLLRNVYEACDQQADILVGSTSNSFTHAMRVGKNRFWVSDFNHAHFIVVFKSVFEEILRFQFCSGMSICSALSTVAATKMVLFPFISRMGDYSSNAEQVPGRLDFEHAIGRLERIMAANKEFINSPNV